MWPQRSLKVTKGNFYIWNQLFLDIFFIYNLIILKLDMNANIIKTHCIRMKRYFILLELTYYLETFRGNTEWIRIPQWSQKFPFNWKRLTHSCRTPWPTDPCCTTPSSWTHARRHGFRQKEKYRMARGKAKVNMMLWLENKAYYFKNLNQFSKIVLFMSLRN